MSVSSAANVSSVSGLSSLIYEFLTGLISWKADLEKLHSVDLKRLQASCNDLYLGSLLDISKPRIALVVCFEAYGLSDLIKWLR